MAYSEQQETGDIGESWAYHQFKTRGFDVKIPPDYFAKSVDLIVNGVPVEVKFANQTYRYKRRKREGRLCKVPRPRWQWSIHDTTHDIKDQVVLVLIAEDEFHERHAYICPGSVMGDRSHFQITSHPDLYTGMLAKWRDEWDVVNYMAQKSFGPRPSYHEWKFSLTGKKVMAQSGSVLGGGLTGQQMQGVTNV